MSEANKPTVCGLLAEKPTKLSQAMHTAGYEALGLDFVYKTFDTVDTKAALEMMKAEGIRGLSLTIPHKENAVALVDELSSAAKKIGAINTVVNDGQKFLGENTDCYGIKQAFEEVGFEFAGKRVLIIGAGGAARAACYTFSESEIFVANRNITRAEKLAADFSAKVISIEGASNYKMDVLVNSTPIGSHLASDGEELLMKCLGSLVEDGLVFDMVTKETKLIKAAKKRGLKTIEGPRMLLHQALEQFRLFTGKAAPMEVMEKALYQELG